MKPTVAPPQAATRLRPPALPAEVAVRPSSSAPCGTLLRLMDPRPVAR